MKLKPVVHVISAFKRGADFGILGNIAAHTMMGEALKERNSNSPIKYGECSGEYGGHVELGWIVMGMEDEEVLEMARSFDQDSIIVVDGQRFARLVYCDGRPALMLGFLVGTPNEPTECDYAYSPETGAYYYTRGVPYAAS
jgi:hypothetical protein